MASSGAEAAAAAAQEAADELMAALRDRAVADLADAAPRELAGLLWGLAAWGERGVPPDDDAFAALAVRPPPPARRTAPCARPAGHAPPRVCVHSGGRC